MVGHAWAERYSPNNQPSTELGSIHEKVFLLLVATFITKSFTVILDVDSGSYRLVGKKFCEILRKDTGIALDLIEPALKRMKLRQGLASFTIVQGVSKLPLQCRH